MLGGFARGGGSGEKRRRRLPEDRAADGEADGRGTGGRRGEPAFDRREVGRFAENDLAARRVRGDRRGRSCARPRRASVPSIFQNSGVSPRRYASAMKPASIAGRPAASNVVFRLPAGARRGLRRTSGLPAPRHHACSASSFAHCPSRIASLVVGSKADEHLDERAGERSGERLGRPRQRKRAGFLRRRADGEARQRAPRQSPRTSTARRRAARRTRAPRPSGRAPAGNRRRRVA